jgi:transposase-like protein
VLILAGIESLMQHLVLLQIQPDSYRPDVCPHCGKQGLWHHGFYARQSGRRGLLHATDDPIPIPRFLCPECRRTCSCLPEPIPPRRWYLWDVQQRALELLLHGISLNQVARQLWPARATIKRWWQRFKDQFDVHASTLRSRFADLGRQVELAMFWSTCLADMPLSRAMHYLHQDGVVIP